MDDEPAERTKTTNHTQGPPRWRSPACRCPAPERDAIASSSTLLGWAEQRVEVASLIARESLRKPDRARGAEEVVRAAGPTEAGLARVVAVCSNEFEIRNRADDARELGAFRAGTAPPHVGSGKCMRALRVHARANRRPGRAIDSRTIAQPVLA
jgi:hypothetical protein